MEKKLYKTRVNKIDGVCGGLAKYFNMDPTTMRLIWAAGLLFASPAAVVGYFACSVIIPREPENNEQ